MATAVGVAHPKVIPFVSPAANDIAMIDCLQNGNRHYGNTALSGVVFVHDLKIQLATNLGRGNSVDDRNSVHNATGTG
jgi:hypothetical protein